MENNWNADAITSLSHRHNNINVVKAAIYTRKSSEEGLKQEFNSLDAHWSMGNLYKLLANPVYIAKLPYKDQALEGQHRAIISKEIFMEVQAILRANNKSHRIKSFAKEACPLAGLLFDENGNKFYPSHSTKKTATPRAIVPETKLSGNGGSDAFATATILIEPSLNPKPNLWGKYAKSPPKR